MIIWTADSSDIQPGQYPSPEDQPRLIEFKSEAAMEQWFAEIQEAGVMVSVLGTFTPYGPELYPHTLGMMN